MRALSRALWLICRSDKEKAMYKKPMARKSTRTRGRRIALQKAVALGIAGVGAELGFPAIIRAQPETIKIGHLTPRTGFLAQSGEYALKGATLAVEEANAAGGALGRKVEMVAEDSVNPATAVTKAQKLVERDKVSCIIGEISSASALAIAEQALRYKTIFLN